MPRRKLYHTNTEKRAANAAKCKRYYQKHKDKILSEKSERRYKLVESKKTEKKQLAAAKVLADQGISTAALLWTERVSLIPTKIITVLTKHPCMCLDDKVRDYIKNQNRNVFERPLNRLYRLSDLNWKYGHHILNAFGAGKEYNKVLEIKKLLDQCINWIQDILLAILGKEDLETMHRKRQFEYQEYGWDFALSPDRIGGLVGHVDSSTYRE